MKNLSIKGPIVDDDEKFAYEWWGIQAVCPGDIEHGLEMANGDDITILVNSGGGSVTAAVEMMESLRSYTGAITNKVVYAASAATIPITVGECIPSPSAIYMIHNASSCAQGDYREMDTASQMLKICNKAIRSAYIAKTGMSEEELTTLMDAETWMSAQDMLDYHFADKILGADADEEEKGTDDVLQTGIYNATMPILSKEQIAKCRTIINFGKEEPKGNDGNLPEQNPVDDKTNIPINKSLEGGTKMTLQEVLVQHPELQDEVSAIETTAKTEGIAEGEQNERARIQDIEKIAGNIADDLVEKAKFTEPKNAKDLAFEAMQSNATLGASYIKNAMADAKEGNAEEVKATPGLEPEEDKDAKLTNRMAERANAKRQRKVGR